MASSGPVQDWLQWLTVTEETLFMHNALNRITDLVELPHDVVANAEKQCDLEVISFDAKNPLELSEKLRNVCGTHNNANARLLEYRLNALIGYWQAIQQLSAEEAGIEKNAVDDALATKKLAQPKEPSGSFSTRVSLLLVLPLLHSQSRFDSSLSSITADLLLNCLRDCVPLSLNKEPQDCLNGLESLLTSWLTEMTAVDKSVDVTSHMVQNTASTLVALACARGSTEAFVRTIHLLQNMANKTKCEMLPVADILQKLLESEGGGHDQLIAILNSHHVIGWNFDDPFNGVATDKTIVVTKIATTTSDKAADLELGRSITCDDKFFYITSTVGKGVVKIGTGFRGTLRGYNYARNSDLLPGWLAWANGILLYRPQQEFDKEEGFNNLAQLLDTCTLKPVKVIVKPPEYQAYKDTENTGDIITTVCLTTDGSFFYWIWTNKHLHVFLDTFAYDSQKEIAIPMRRRVMLNKKDDSAGANKTPGEEVSVLSRLRGFRPNTTLITLTAGEAQTTTSNKKDDSSTNTSVGVTLKTLLKTPILCDGNTLVLITPSPGTNPVVNAARSVFGSTPNLSGLRVLATNNWFDLKDGHFLSRVDLMDAPNSALSRCSSLSGFGICYDVFNNYIWCCTNDFIDQFLNPAHQARHHILLKLGLEQNYTNVEIVEDNQLSRSDVVYQLLLHVSTTCVHHINSQLASSTGILSLLTANRYDQPTSSDMDGCNLNFVCDIMEKAVNEDDQRMLINGLVLIQCLFQTVSKRKRTMFNKEVNVRLSDFIWKVLNKYKSGFPRDKGSIILKQACRTLCDGLGHLYPDVQDRLNLLQKLLSESSTSSDYLRDLLLDNFTEQLNSHPLLRDEQKFLWLNEDLMNHLMKIVVKESCSLLKQSQSATELEFDQILASVPVSSSCLRFLMALQSSILRQVVFHSNLVSQDSLQHLIMMLSSNVLSAAAQILEVLIENCHIMLQEKQTNAEYWLQGLERLAKATALGHMLPVLTTTLTHKSLQCLSVADKLMSQLVQLVILASQAALLVKSPSQSSNSTSTDEEHISKLVGHCHELNEEEQGFLAGLKIPTPWSTGKTVESSHPVRDNYKFKETVHIPGARCLYLKFDQRCATQYDYDKLVLYAGSNTGCRKVGEYGGNTLGYGSRSVLGAGWPKEFVKVEGDTVTFSFEMRSGREHNTPDKALWGFSVTVKAQDSNEEVSSGLPFLADLALSLSVLSCTMLRLLYQGPERSKDEEACQHLLNTKLLQRCSWLSSDATDKTWSVDDNTYSTDSLSKKNLPRIKLPCEIANKLRSLSERLPPQIRPSIEGVVRPDVLEETILSATIRHLSLNNTVQNITYHEHNHTSEYAILKEVMADLYKRFYALLRQLQCIADLEQRWKNELSDIVQGNILVGQAFFVDFHLVENKLRDLAILCFLKDIAFDPANLDDAVSNLLDRMAAEQSQAKEMNFNVKDLPRTTNIVSALLERLELLLQVTIAPEVGTGITRSTSCIPEMSHTVPNVMIRSDTDVIKPGSFLPQRTTTSAAADVGGMWADDSVIDIFTTKKKWPSVRKGPVTSRCEADEKDRPAHVALIDELFSFIGSNPEKAVSCKSFLSAAHLRWRRGQTRTRSLVYMKELLMTANKVGGATHLVAAVTSVLQFGPKVDELHCGGMVSQVREAFAETMMTVVQLAARYPVSCCNSIGLLCIIPYTRAEEKCLVRSGLVHLLDKLCSLSQCRCAEVPQSEIQSVQQKVSSMAWAGFQVLSNRCVMWESCDGWETSEFGHSGLARQVSTLLTNHLSHATEGRGNEAASNEALQEVLNLLNTLSRSKMGQAILSQPACVSKLLSLLLDQRPSPKLVLIILQLCRVALPLMSAEDCDRVDLPAWGQDFVASVQMGQGMDKSLKIVSLLLAKLGDFLVPGGHTTIESHRESLDRQMSHHLSSAADRVSDPDVRDGRLSVFVHKREEQSPHEVIQPLLSSDSQVFRLSGSANMDKVVRMDRDLTKTGKAEVTTEESSSALRKAAKWAQMGLIISTGQPIDTLTSSTSSDNGNTAADKKKLASEVICKGKNADLAKTDAIRPFISSHVANSMAAEVIALLYSLISAPETQAADTWTIAVEQVITKTLSFLPELLNSLDDVISLQSNRTQLMFSAKQINATLAALGGFDEMIRPGCEVQIIGEGSFARTSATVVSVSDQTGLAAVQLQPPTSENFTPTRFADQVQVPISRLTPASNQLLPLHKMSITTAMVTAIHTLLLSRSGIAPASLVHQIPIHGTDATGISNQICRIVAEVKSRACKVLSSYLKDAAFAGAFIQQSGCSIDTLKSLAKDCNAGERLSVVMSRCQRLRMLYIDCAKPPPPPSKACTKPVRDVLWDVGRAYPPIRSCVFSQSSTEVTFMADPSAPSNQPRGVLIYANVAVPHQVASFYWELEILSIGDPQDDGGPILAFGFMPAADKKDSNWANPVGTCLLHNTGRAVHYNGSSLLQWRSVRLDITLAAGSIAGIGWERNGDSPPPLGHTAKGTVYFTFNGRRLGPTIEEVSGSMWPVVHLQKKNTKIRANFGKRPYAYADGSAGHTGLDNIHDITREIRETFGALPFHISSDSDSEGPNPSSTTTSDVSTSPRTSPGPPCRTANIPKSLREYNSEISAHYKLSLSYGNLTQTGPDLQTQQANVDDESDIDDKDDAEPSEDNYTLLVKAWEQKVFPVIRRRFRNEAERKDGLEQIRGALQLGMTDIARQTVEFLYEENGGMPRDLHLPTIDDIKDELAKFTIDRLRKGTVVVIKTISSAAAASGTILLPKFAVRSMLKTFGLVGVVLDVDQANELVEIETYLRSDGILVRYWYPLDALERPASGYRKSSIVGGGHKVLDVSSISIHRELLKTESMLSKLYCRLALLELISQCNRSEEIVACLPSLGSAAASAAILQELDVENLQLLSNDLLASPQPHGCITATSLLTSSNLRRCHFSSSPSDVFYDDCSKLKEELHVAITRAANQGEDYLLELSNQICLCLQTSPEMFPYEEFPVSETKICTDVHFPGVAYLVISCRADPKAIKKDISLYKAPWARVFVYRGHRIKRNGVCNKQEVVSYPRDLTLSCSSNDRFSPVIIPADLVHIRVGVSPPAGMIITIHGIPPQMPLAMAYIETLVSQNSNFEYKKMESPFLKSPQKTSVSDLSGRPGTYKCAWRSLDSVVISSSVLLHIIELLSGYISRTDISAIIKESVFHLLAQTLRVLYLSESDELAKVPNFVGTLGGFKTLFAQLQGELCRLYDDETKLSSSSSSGSVRYSVYLQSLMEVCLAIAELTSPILPSLSSCSEFTSSLSPSAEGLDSKTLTLVPSFSFSGKRKKIKVKRERGSSTPKRGSSPCRTISESDSPMSTSPHASSSVGAHASASAGALASSHSPSATTSGTNLSLSSKPEETLWFHRALTMSQILRYIINSDPIGLGVILDAVTDAYETLCTSTAHSRLVVISNIPKNLNSMSVRNALFKAACSCGGLFMEDLYLPLVEKETDSSESKPSKESDTTTSSVDQPVGPPVSVSDIDVAVDNQKTVDLELKGFAVMQLRSRAKLESFLKALMSSKLAILGSSFKPHELADLSEDMLGISSVNSSLFTNEHHGNAELESYLSDRLIANRATFDLCDNAVLALTEIFHSCFFAMEQRLCGSELRHDSGYIYLTAEQIVMSSSANLMYLFFSNVRHQKKTCLDQVINVLKRYGVSKSADKESEEKKLKPFKKPTRISKEKMTSGVNLTKTPSSERKVKSRETPEKQVKPMTSPKTCKSTDQVKDDEHTLTLDGFLLFVVDKIKEDVRSVWKALFACGFDLQFDRSACIDASQAQQMSSLWNLEMDVALVKYVNKLCRHLAISPSRLHAHEIYIEEAELNSSSYNCMQGIPLESIRLRFALLQSLNNTLETFFLPLVDLRPAMSGTFPRSVASLLCNARGIIFYDTKVSFVNKVLNSTALRKPDQAAPEIVLNPLDSIQLQGEKKSPMDSYLCQAVKQLLVVPSSQLCVRLAAGGDPTYSFNVKFIGEEVHGTSGSFRHFLWQVAKELEHGSLNLLLPVSNTSGIKNCGKFLFTSEPPTYSEEKVLQFFGQLLAISVRADIPFGLDLVLSFWKTLVNQTLDPVTDLQEADAITYNYLKKFEMVESDEEFVASFDGQLPYFVYPALGGGEVELIGDGRNIQVTWDNKDQYVDCIRSMRMSELACLARMSAVVAGFASVIPIQLLMLMTPDDAEFRICGLPEVNLEFLKAHTMYQVGLTENDSHIQYFWKVLESFSQEELRRFVKFACNQERIPQTCPCRDGGHETAHVPPYPMKIAPPDGTGPPDSRYIRTETCMFMVKLPQYSTQDIMREHLLSAIHYRDDPLIG